LQQKIGIAFVCRQAYRLARNRYGQFRLPIAGLTGVQVESTDIGPKLLKGLVQLFPSHDLKRFRQGYANVIITYLGIYPEIHRQGSTSGHASTATGTHRSMLGALEPAQYTWIMARL
jgi:hypothetical protein